MLNINTRKSEYHHFVHRQYYKILKIQQIFKAESSLNCTIQICQPRHDLQIATYVLKVLGLGIFPFVPKGLDTKIGVQGEF